MVQDAILDRYQKYIRLFGVQYPRILRAQESIVGERKWIYPLMSSVIEGIRQHDRACIEIGVEFLESEEKFAFGKSLKSLNARALRQTSLTELQVKRVRNRVLQMLVAKMVPHEYREYSKLLRKVGLGDEWDRVRDELDVTNRWVKRYYDYFERHAGKEGR